jgi:hypothetical protein
MFNKSNLSKVYSVSLPLSIFTATFLFHYFWHVFFPEQNPTQEKWILIPDDISSLKRYVDSKSYWFGYTYGICLAFISIALRKYLKDKCNSYRNIALGGMTLTGFWAVAACFLIGCCGSPMIVVWLNLFGAAFMPLAKPFIALITTVSLIITWFWMSKKNQPNNCEFNRDTTTHQTKIK